MLFRSTNLALNGLQAMQPGGTLHMVVSKTEGPSAECRIDVVDDGHGILDEHKTRLFEPFFTTKGVGVGTGLGLAVSWGIVAEHGGRIEVESRTGAGTRFVVHLPGVSS